MLRIFYVSFSWRISSNSKKGCSQCFGALTLFCQHQPKRLATSFIFYFVNWALSYIKKPRDCFIGNSKDCLRDHKVNSLLYQTFGDSLKLSTLRAENQWQLVGFSWLHFFFLVSYKHVMELFSSPLWKTPFKSLLQPNKEVINTPRLYLFPNSFEGIFLMLYIIGDELLLKF